MNIIILDPATLEEGRESLRGYMAAQLCGRDAKATYEDGMFRFAGLAAVPGAITECIEIGFGLKEAIIHAVSRVTCCRRTTVEAVLDALTGTDPAIHLWTVLNGRYRILEETSARVLLAA